MINIPPLLPPLCPRCGYDGQGMYNGRKGYQSHTKQLNPSNTNKLICGNCSEAFK